MISGELISAVLGVGLGFILGIITGIGIQGSEDSALQERMAEPEWRTVEAWGMGYMQGFEDSMTLCEQLLQQQEMMREPMEQPLHGRDEATGSGTDRHGTPLTRSWGTAVPPYQD